ncbi:MAG TPA: hypothetical protein VEQ58_15510 [Polyangiaceae bacterium]|nr:hypothetical protein [Polyangiaceae bacterium]
MSINLHIETLLLEGLELSRAQAERVRAALTSELSRLLETGALEPEQLQAVVSRLEAPPLAVSTNWAPEQLGAQLATSVLSGIQPTSGGAGGGAR